MTPGVRVDWGGGRAERGIVFLKVTANSPAIVHFAKEIVPLGGKRSLIFNKESSPCFPFQEGASFGGGKTGTG